MSDTGIKVDSLGKAETLNAQFQQVFTQEDLSYIPNAASCGTAGMDPIIFDVEGIKKLLQNVNCKKANGPDNIPTQLIKDTAPEIVEVVCFLFNQSYTLSQLPADWCKANVVPIFKKGAKQDPNNYSPVSLTVALCKLTGVPYGAALQNTRSTGRINCAGWEIEHSLLNLLESLYKHHACCEITLQRGFWLDKKISSL